MSPSARLALLLGLALGIGLGLLYTWVIDPVEYADTEPPSLRADFKADYAVMAAQAYARDRDLDRARARLTGLGVSDPAAFLTSLVETAAGPSPDLRYLAGLARDLGGTSPALEPYLP